MPRDFLQGAKDAYDVVVIGSGLGGLTVANILGRAGYSVLLLEQHYKLGGLATWFKRPGGHIFDISLHGFPHGMVKTCRKYWGKHIAEKIVRLDGIRFENRNVGIIDDKSGMGSAPGDYDNDGDVDWFVSSIFYTNPIPDHGNRLYRNNDENNFKNMTEEANARQGLKLDDLCNKLRQQ